MLDDLWTRITVKSRWMDETAGGCTNFISWRNNNQWLRRRIAARLPPCARGGGVRDSHVSLRGQ